LRHGCVVPAILTLHELDSTPTWGRDGEIRHTKHRCVVPAIHTGRQATYRTLHKPDSAPTRGRNGKLRQTRDRCVVPAILTLHELDSAPTWGRDGKLRHTRHGHGHGFYRGEHQVMHCLWQAAGGEAQALVPVDRGTNSSSHVLSLGAREIWTPVWGLFGGSLGTAI